MSTQGPVPQLIVGRSVILQIVEEAKAHPPTETGQALLGIERPGEIIVVGTIPDLLDTVRETGLFSQGGMDQVEVFRWLNQHWEAARISSRNPNQQTGWNHSISIPKGTIPMELDNPLEHVGDWHKHPGRYTDLSGTDLQTIRSILTSKEAPRDQFLTPIVTTSQAQLEYAFDGNTMESSLISGEKIHVIWYWTGKNSVRPIRLNPIVVSDDKLPWLPPLSWHLTNITRMRTELALLQQLGVSVRWAAKQMDDDPVMEVIFGLDHESWKNQVVFITDWDYPNSAPKIQLFKKQVAKVGAPAVVTKTQPIDSFWNAVLRFLSGKQKEVDIFAPKELVWRNRWDPNVYLTDVLWDLDQKGQLLNVG